MSSKETRKGFPESGRGRREKTELVGFEGLRSVGDIECGVKGDLGYMAFP